MKRTRTLATLLVIMTICSTLTCAIAGELTMYNLPQVDINIAVPMDMYVLTRETVEGDAVLEETYMDIEFVQSMMENNNMYLDAIAQDFSHEIMVSVIDSGDSELDFRNLKVAEVEDYMEKLNGGDETFKRRERGVMTINDTHYLCYENTLDNEDGTFDYGKQYVTITNGKYVFLSLATFGEECSEAQLEDLDSMVDSMTYDMPPPSKNSMSYNKVSSKTWSSIAIVIVGVAMTIFKAVSSNRKSKPENSQSYNQPESGDLDCSHADRETGFEARTSISTEDDDQHLRSQPEELQGNVSANMYTYCDACGQRIPRRAAVCPHCKAKTRV